jgi:hypothetical protein
MSTPGSLCTMGRQRTNSATASEPARDERAAACACPAGASTSSRAASSASTIINRWVCWVPSHATSTSPAARAPTMAPAVLDAYTRATAALLLPRPSATAASASGKLAPQHSEAGSTTRKLRRKSSWCRYHGDGALPGFTGQ